MGRGRGKGKRLTAVPSHEDAGSGGEEFLPIYRRRGRPQKPLKDDLDEDVAQKIEQDGDEMKVGTMAKETKIPMLENGKRKRRLRIKDKSDSSNEENGDAPQPKMEDSTRSNGFRQNGSRRKSTPRRAAEAGVECILD